MRSAWNVTCWQTRCLGRAQPAGGRRSPVLGGVLLEGATARDSLRFDYEVSARVRSPVMSATAAGPWSPAGCSPTSPVGCPRTRWTSPLDDRACRSSAAPRGSACRPCRLRTTRRCPDARRGGSVDGDVSPRAVAQVVVAAGRDDMLPVLTGVGSRSTARRSRCWRPTASACDPRVGLEPEPRRSRQPRWFRPSALPTPPSARRGGEVRSRLAGAGRRGLDRLRGVGPAGRRRPRGCSTAIPRSAAVPDEPRRPRSRSPPWSTRSSGSRWWPSATPRCGYFQRRPATLEAAAATRPGLARPMEANFTGGGPDHRFQPAVSDRRLGAFVAALVDLAFTEAIKPCSSPDGEFDGDTELVPLPDHADPPARLTG